MSKTYYDILGLRASATQDEIKRAYRKKAMESHPDVNPTPGAAEVFVRINEAYAILSDSQKRLVYNQKLRDQAARAAGNSYAQNTQSARDEAYRQWVQQAKAQAAASANMNYQDFKRTRFGKAEASVFLYLQFALIGMFLVLGLLIMLAPFTAMFYIDWKFVFMGLVLVPVAFKIFELGLAGFKDLKASL
jgi:curved DNA-binding protein CbpA